MTSERWRIEVGDGPIVAAANHSGHGLRAEVARLMALDDTARFREEDPYTDEWTTIAPTRIVPLRSRFEVDLNRSRETAVYLTPDDAWGLKVWQRPLPDDVRLRSLQDYDAYYARISEIFTEKARVHGAFCVLDLHSYNHRRDGSSGPAADPERNPEINVGTGTMQRARWSALVDRFISDLKSFDFLGRSLDVRENVKFVGRQLPAWTHQNFADSGCVLAVEVKKFFMDEWSGEKDIESFHALTSALAATVPGMLDELKKLGAKT